MPSVYLSEHFGTLEDRKLYVYGQLKEALRVKGSNSRAAVLPYSRFKYRDTGNFYNVVGIYKCHFFILFIKVYMRGALYVRVYGTL